MELAFASWYDDVLVVARDIALRLL